MKNVIKKCACAVLLLTVLLSMCACSEEVIKLSETKISCVNSSDQTCYMWLSGEEKGGDKLILKGGTRNVDVHLTYNMTGIEEKDEAGVLQREPLKLFVEKSDGTKLEYAFDAAYGEGADTTITITFDGTGFDIKQTS